MNQGRSIEVLFQDGLRDTAGNPAHAATSIRQRVIFLDPELKANPPEQLRILLHELFHFAWVRLGNPQRLCWEQLLQTEWEARARGEAGWSAEWRKKKLSAADVGGRSRRWREYCCESFCDTAAFVYGDSRAEVTLGRKWLAPRTRWFEGRRFPI